MYVAEVLRDGAGSAVTVAAVEFAVEWRAAWPRSRRVRDTIEDALAALAGGDEGCDDHEEDNGELHCEEWWVSSWVRGRRCLFVWWLGEDPLIFYTWALGNHIWIKLSGNPGAELATPPFTTASNVCRMNVEILTQIDTFIPSLVGARKNTCWFSAQ